MNNSVGTFQIFDHDGETIGIKGTVIGGNANVIIGNGKNIKGHLTLLGQNKKVQIAVGLNGNTIRISGGYTPPQEDNDLTPKKFVDDLVRSLYDRVSVATGEFDGSVPYWQKEQKQYVSSSNIRIVEGSYFAGLSVGGVGRGKDKKFGVIQAYDQKGFATVTIESSQASIIVGRGMPNSVAGKVIIYDQTGKATGLQAVGEGRLAVANEYKEPVQDNELIQKKFYDVNKLKGFDKLVDCKNNAEAKEAGVPYGGLYRTGTTVKVRMI